MAQDDEGKADMHHRSDPDRAFNRRWSDDQGRVRLRGETERSVTLQAVRHWLRQIDDLDGDERVTALVCADEILAAGNLSWTDLLEAA